MTPCNSARTRIVRSQEQNIISIRPGMHYVPENVHYQDSLMTAVTLEPLSSPSTPEYLPEQKVAAPYLHEVIPNPPSYLIAQNELLPDGYQEVVDYEDIQYLNGFLRTLIGKDVECDFLVGSNNTVKERGVLTTVGVNYFVLNNPETNKNCVCDYFALKFVHCY